MTDKKYTEEELLFELHGRRMKCTVCKEFKPKVNFVLDADDPDKFVRTCHSCMDLMMSRPDYKKGAILNYLKNVVAKDNGLFIQQITEEIMKKCLAGDMKAIEFLFDRIEGPVTQKVEATHKHSLQDKLVQESEELMQHLRDNGENTITDQKYH